MFDPENNLFEQENDSKSSQLLIDEDYVFSSNEHEIVKSQEDTYIDFNPKASSIGIDFELQISQIEKASSKCLETKSINISTKTPDTVLNNTIQELKMNETGEKQK